MNPVFRLDFSSFSIRPRFFVIRVLVPGASLLGLVLVLMSGIPFVAAPDQAGQVIFWFSSFPALLAALCIAPALFSPLICDERHGKTLEILRSSPLRPLQLVLGKWSSRLALLGLVCLAGLPLVASALLYGGVRPAQFFDFVVLLVSSILWVSAMAIYVGARTLDVGAAMRWAYFILFMTCIGTLFAAAMLTGTSLGTLREVALGLNPLAAIFELYGVGAHSPILGVYQPWFYALASLVLTLLFLALTHRAVARDTRSNRVWKWSRRRALSGIVLTDQVLERHPLLWLELGGYARARRPLLSVITVLAVVALEGVFVFALQDALQSAAAMGIGQAVALPLHMFYIYGAAGWGLLVIAVSGAVAFQTQRDANTIDVLNAAPLTTPGIVNAKAAGVFARGAPWLGLSMLHVCIAVATGSIPLVSLIAYTACLAVMAWLMGGFALMMGARSRSPGGAVASVIGIMIGMHFGLGVGLGIVALVMGKWDAAQLALSFHPGYYLAAPMVLGLGDLSDAPPGALGLILASGLYIWLGWYFGRLNTLRAYTLRREYGWFDLHTSPAHFYRQRRALGPASPDMPTVEKSAPVTKEQSQQDQGTAAIADKALEIGGRDTSGKPGIVEVPPLNEGESHEPHL